MNNKLTLYEEENNTISDLFDLDDYAFSQTHRYNSYDNTNQKIQKFQIFNPQHQATLGFIKLDGKITQDIPPQISDKPIKKQKQTSKNAPICHLCSKSFESHKALGGHLSRAHPNQSEKFKTRIAKADGRKHELLRTRQLQAIALSDLKLL
ncbi:unnamed protein product (macronuclear) [Paramecium tetraurelia]|uniref:C2H2-type domain-containing protein n=1 Tax=Paramecium tetraurelia TaxID=5888 RepID=A0BNW0_PARTE|nr:uncharacterized protein GSPATT00030866001 [Paramecium tetraurelia]CAK60227.1 unnamed protein product [Paramecium tetraurelia]|eukprot:XP_001427625.1 hypothetical protein (macronuclear) [Paramecium tetraurelia strain d4-2]